MRQWKQWLQEVERLNAEIGRSLYERARLLVAIFEDAEFRAENDLADDFKAADWLQSHNPGSGFTVLDYRRMLAFQAAPEQWADPLKLWDEMRAAEKANAETSKCKSPARWSCTKAEVEHLQRREAWLEKELATRDQRIRELEGQLARLHKELAIRDQRIRELEGQLRDDGQQAPHAAAEIV